MWTLLGGLEHDAETFLILLFFPVAILLIGVPVALFVRCVVEIAQRL